MAELRFSRKKASAWAPAFAPLSTFAALTPFATLAALTIAALAIIAVPFAVIAVRAGAEPGCRGHGHAQRAPCLELH
ncbi:MAG TPA: hypothetical protein PLK37_07685 [Terricaulis sp.]|nr:hypothetical protein [Terricaulis sp.]